MSVRHPKLKQRVLVYVTTDVLRPGTIVGLPEPDKHPPGEYYTVRMEETGKEQLTARAEILTVLPDDDSLEALERWLAKR